MRAILRLLVPALSAVALGASLAVGGGAAGASGGYAPLDRPGPALSVPAATLRAALSCHGSFTANSLEPVLLNPGTGVTPDQNFSWNYERAFAAQGRPWCALTMPYHTLGDIQTAGEYLVYGIRTEYAMGHRKIAVLGHSQGGMSMRWALRFWPDTRPLIADVIGMAGDNHGTTVPIPCKMGVTTCTPAVWQQLAGSRFIAALNSGAETFPTVSYTEIYSHTDEVVQPDSNDAHATSAVTPGPNVTNVATQNICPLDLDEHLLIGTIDPVTYALVMDALTHAGPAKPSRISMAVCLQLYQPGVNPLTVAPYLQMLSAVPGLASVPLPDANLVGAPQVASEPALRCYTTAAGC